MTPSMHLIEEESMMLSPPVTNKYCLVHVCSSILKQYWICFSYCTLSPSSTTTSRSIRLFSWDVWLRFTSSLVTLVFFNVLMKHVFFKATSQVFNDTDTSALHRKELYLCQLLPTGEIVTIRLLCAFLDCLVIFAHSHFWLIICLCAHVHVPL